MLHRMNVCPTFVPAAPPPEIVPVMLASLLVPIGFIAAVIGLVVFLVVKVVQAGDRHQAALVELGEWRGRAAALEAELERLRAGG